MTEPRPMRFLTFVFLLAAMPCLATVATSTEPPYTQARLQDKINDLDGKQDIEDGIKSRLLTLYRSAKNNLDTLDAFIQRKAAFKRSIKEAPLETKRLQNEINQLQAQLAQQVPEDFSRISTEELEQRLILEKEKISGLDEQIKKLANEQVLQNSRPPLIRSEMVAAQQEIDTSQKKLEGLSLSDKTKPEIEAEQIYLKTAMDARAAELNSLEIEAISNPSRIERLQAKLLWLSLQKDSKNHVVAAIESLLAERRQKDAKQAQDALTQAEKELAGKPAVIQAITHENIRYSQELQGITDNIEHLLSQKTLLDSKALAIEEDFKDADKKIALASVSPALGKILREQRRNLALDSQLATWAETVQNETALASLSVYRVEERLKKLLDSDTVLKELMVSQVPETLLPQQRMMIQAELRVLLNSQKDLLNKLEAAGKTYLRALGEFDFTREQMAAKTKRFADYLDENLLWVPSANPINMNFPADLLESMRMLISPSDWAAVAKDSLNAVAKWPFATATAALGWLLLLVSRGQCKKQLVLATQRLGKPYTDRFAHTLMALLYTASLVLPLPVLAYGWGWLLSNPNDGSHFGKAVGVGLQSAAVAFVFLQFVYQLFASNGVFRRHFHWQKDSVLLFRAHMGWLRWVVVPTAFLISITHASPDLTHSDSLGRLALIVVLAGLSVFLYRLLNPQRCIVQPFLLAHPHSWANKLRLFWFPFAVLCPIVFIGFAATGYYLSALELQQKLMVTLRFMFLVLIIHQLVLRWLTLVNRQIAFENIRKKKKAATQSEKHPVPQGGEERVLPIDEYLIDIPKINAQTMKLLAMCISFALLVGLWLIWGNILPAFSFLDQIVLWQHETLIDKQLAMQPITLTNLLLALLYGFVMMVSVANFSGLMELLLFGRMDVEAGSRYAINQIAKYVMVSIGLFVIVNELGGSWSQLQWLVAALGVGLGFGLQEIFANLVSGIILLFERPIRIGDTVTIGEVTGKVCRIQMRATTIMDWDQKELIVPNKTFITNELVNWTLSDAVTRVVIPVGIAYGSDAEKAHQIMMDTITATPLVLTDPEPCVLFMEFGDNALIFSVRVFVSEMAHRLPLIHNLHMRLEKALRDNNIEIPLPQHHVHIRSSTPIPPVAHQEWQRAFVSR